MLEALISSRTRVKLLTLFLVNPEKEYYVREIARLTQENYNAVRRELKNLSNFGLITGQDRGNQQYYTVNRSFFLFDELQKIILKTEGAAAVIGDALAQLSGITCMFIYGSFARGTAGKESDVDLFIIGDIDERVLIPRIHASEQAIHREINYTLMRAEEFRRRKQNRDPFVKNVMDEAKIMITGACNDTRP